MGYDTSLYNEPNTKTPDLSLFEKSYYSKAEYDFIKKSFEEIEKITKLHSQLNKANSLEAQALIKQLNNIEKEFILHLHRIADHRKIAKIHSQSADLLHFMFRVNLFFILIVMAITTAILLFLPITQLVFIALSAIIVSTVILFQINAILLKDESPILPAIKNTIAFSIAQLDHLIEASTQFRSDIFIIIIEDVDQNESKKTTNKNLLYNTRRSFFPRLSLSERRWASVPSLCNTEAQATTNDNTDNSPLQTSTP